MRARVGDRQATVYRRLSTIHFIALSRRSGDRLARIPTAGGKSVEPTMGIQAALGQVTALVGG